MESPSVRLARREDAAAIARIYNQGIEDRIATFDIEPRTVEDIEARTAGLHPLVVAERGGENVSLGFREVGIYRRHAKLDGAWKDVVIVEKLLGEAARAD